MKYIKTLILLGAVAIAGCTRPCNCPPHPVLLQLLSASYIDSLVVPPKPIPYPHSDGIIPPGATQTR